MTLLQPIPVISRNCPAYTNDSYQGSFDPSLANNSFYHDTWRCIAAPASNADSGVLTQFPAYTTPFPVYLAYDLSGVSAIQRGQVVLAWYDDTPGEGAYDPNLIGNSYINQANAYTIDVNPAAGGSLPGSGWVTKATITGNTYHSRQHVVDMTGNNWIRVNITAILGSAANNNAAMDMDIHDAHLGVQDSWIFYGDSITQRGLDHDDSSGIGGIAPAQINAARGPYFPLWEGAGVGGWTATDAVAAVGPTFLPLFPGRYVGLNFGTNDASRGGAPLTSYSANMQSMITSILNAGKIPVIPHIPWGSDAGIVANGPTVNAAIDALIAANPGCIAGPDLWAYFQANQSLISGDGIHPTDPAGYAAYRLQWVNWATGNIYFNTLQTTTRTAFKVRTVLGSIARTAFKVRSVLRSPGRSAFKIGLSGVGPKPYTVTDVTAHGVERPNSTISSQAIVLDKNSVLQNAMTATVTVTYPDKSTASPQVYWVGNGTYQIIYNTKTAGTLTELWIFTDGQGSQAEYQNTIICSF